MPYICLGITDEHHLYCPFTTDDQVEAWNHAKLPGHEVWWEDDTVEKIEDEKVNSGR